MSYESKTPLLLGVTSSIILEKNHLAQHQPDYNDFDAVIHCVTRTDKASQLIYRDFDYTIAASEIIVVEPGINFQLRETIIDKDTGMIKKSSFIIYSESEPNTVLRDWIRRCRVEYEASRSNKLGDEIYYFDQTDTGEVGHVKALSFNRQPFRTSRALSNVFFDNKQEVVSRVNLFRNKPEWYAARGIPRTLGLLFHGDPGCGKTSCIKAIANETKRHIINVKLGNIRTNVQLNNLFRNPVLQVINPDNMIVERISIPINKRLYVIEDIDAMTSWVLKREFRSETKERKIVPPSKLPAKKITRSAVDEDEELAEYFASSLVEEKEEMATEAKKEEERDRITLDSLLNAIDGTCENPERILIMTTNHPDVIDPALIRPGRIDSIVHFKSASRQMMVDMFNSFYTPTDPFKLTMFERVPEFSISPARLNQIMFANFDKPATALADLHIMKK